MTYTVTTDGAHEAPFFVHIATSHAQALSLALDVGWIPRRPFTELIVEDENGNRKTYSPHDWTEGLQDWPTVDALSPAEILQRIGSQPELPGLGESARATKRRFRTMLMSDDMLRRSLEALQFHWDNVSMSEDERYTSALCLDCFQTALSESETIGESPMEEPYGPPFPAPSL